jgi:competence protein ComFC
LGIKNFLKAVFDTAGQLLFPPGVTCPACGGELDGTTTDGLCTACRPVYNKTFCRRCGRGIGNLAELCETCIAHGEYDFTAARSPLVYEDTAKRLVYAFKYGGAKYLAHFMADKMAECCRENGFTPDVLTFVPLHKKRKRRRGYNQSELLAAALGKALSVPHTPLLEKTVHTKNLAKLNRAGRVAVIKDSFSFTGTADAVKNKTVLLVDDVLTTGATSGECARVLKKAGAKEIFVITFASVLENVPKGQTKTDNADPVKKLKALKSE